jgi:acyl-CoA thioesterase
VRPEIDRRVGTLPPVPSRFATDSAVARDAADADLYHATIDRGWWIEMGPNGGYVGAILSRAMTEAVGDPTRTLRSFTVHYLRPPVEGPAQVRTTLERTGRSMTTVTARLEQAGRPLAISLAAFASARPSLEFCDVVPPDVPPPEELRARDEPPMIELGRRYETRWALGGLPFSGSDVARAGGWIRLAPAEGSQPLDHHLLVAFTDAWMPPVFVRTPDRMAVPTVDLTVHVRSPLPEAYDDWCLVDFRTTVAHDGFLEEDGAVWTRDGTLLAQSRQLAVILPFA